MRIRIATLCSLLFASAATAAPPPALSTEYSANRRIESDQGVIEGSIAAAPGRERSEMRVSGMSTVMILRSDRGLGWMLMPAQKMYMTMDFAKAAQQSGAAQNDQIDITEVGTETVEGQTATKYKMLMKDGSGGGFIWVTAQGIPVKMDFLSKSGGEKSRMTVTLKNLQIGSQDAQNFELPSGYTAMPNMGNFGSGMRR